MVRKFGSIEIDQYESSRHAAAVISGFFSDWTNPPTPELTRRILDQSYRAFVAVDPERNAVVGLVTCVSDGLISAYVPLLEVLEPYRRRGLGRALCEEMFKSLANIYMIDLVCDANVVGFYERLGMKQAGAMIFRNYYALSCSSGKSIEKTA